VPVVPTIRDGCVVLMLIGDFSTDDFIEAGEAALTLPDFKPGMPMLVDARASFAYASGEEMLKRVDGWSPSNRKELLVGARSWPPPIVWK
jgi:hypothetical protein